MKRLALQICVVIATFASQSAIAQQIISNGPVIVPQIKSRRELELMEQQAEAQRAEEARRAAREETLRMYQAQTRTSAAPGASQYDGLSQGDALAGTAAASCARGNGVVIRTSGGFDPSQSGECKK